MSEASIRTQFKKGQSGNPKGRPKRPKSLEEQRDTLTRIACALLDQPCHVLGSDRTETRMEQWMRDLAARGDLGELRCMNTVFNFADRGDRRRLQALRLARKAKKPRDRYFEEYAADLIAQPPPKLRPDQEHVILPAREVRLEHEKPRPKRDPGFWNAKGEPELYNKKGEINPWYLEKVEPDLSAHQPKYLSVAELRAREQERIDEMMRRHREMREADAKLRAEEAAEAAAKIAPEDVETTAEITDQKTGVITGLGTGLITGVVSGPITGLSGIVRPQQTLDASRKSKLLNSTSDFSHLISPRNDDDVHVNGVQMNGKSMNGSSLNGSRHNGHS